jgi:hypothetical protein
MSDRSNTDKKARAFGILYDCPVKKCRDGKYVFYPGPGYSVHVTERMPGKWVAKKAGALENIGIGDNPIEAMQQAKRHYEAYIAEIRARVNSPEVQAAMGHR